MARYPSGKKYQHQYRNLLVTTWSERGVYYATVLQPDTGYEVTVETLERNPFDAGRFALQMFADGVKPEMSPAWAEAAEVLGDDAREALEEVDADELEIGASLGSGRPKVECRYRCPGGLVPDEVSIWPRSGETANEACKRYLMKRYRMDEYQFSLCEKIQVRYID